MKKKVIIGIIIVVVIILALVVITNYMDSGKVELKAVVVKVNEKNMLVMGTERANELVSVRFTDEGNIGFKQGQ
ncbi:MAG: hypothetical protein ACLTBX_04365 [Clostridia bacterium]